MTSPGWYYAKDDQQFGPVTAAQLKQLAATGELSSDCRVWRDGMKEWKLVSDVPGLAAVLKPDPVPSVAPSPTAPRLSEATAPEPKGLADRLGFVYHIGTICKVLSVLWSLYCLVGAGLGAINVLLGDASRRIDSTAEVAGFVTGVAIGLAMWVFLWIAIAGPLTLLWAATRIK